MEISVYDDLKINPMYSVLCFSVVYKLNNIREQILEPPT